MKTKLLLTITILTLIINGFGQNSPQNNSQQTDKKERVQIAQLEKDNKDSEKSEEAKSKELKNLKNRLLQDNGFLVEEAFAQEEDYIQHAYRFRRSFNGNGWEGVFEEELPLGNEKHQLSISIPMAGFKSNEHGKVVGFGDVELNYRYQLIGGESSRISIAPGVSAILPTGSYRRELGLGGLGVELSFPVSIAINSRFMSHSNIGVTLTPRSRNDEGERAFTKNLEVGQSLVWLAHPKFNPLIEFVWERNQEVIGNRLTKREHELFISPGFRWGHTFKNGMTIVPGIAFPLGVGPSKGQNGVFFYLSFEHPFKKRED